MTLYDLHCRSLQRRTSRHGKIGTQKAPSGVQKCGKKRAYRTMLAPPAYHDHYSPLHPRAGRGKGIGRKA